MFTVAWKFMSLSAFNVSVPLRSAPVPKPSGLGPFNNQPFIEDVIVIFPASEPVLPELVVDIVTSPLFKPARMSDKFMVGLVAAIEGVKPV